MLNPRSVVDIPKFEIGEHGLPRIIRPASPPEGELSWCKRLVARFDEWRHLVDVEAAEKITLEYRCRFWDMPETPNAAMGLPRIDAVIWHDAKRCTLVEAKVKTDPSNVMGGVGQLIYYKAWMERVEGYKVEALVLAAPSLPLLVLEAIQDVRANIRFLKFTDGLISGLTPRYDDGEVPEGGKA